jgi:hypothetical protein
MMLLGIERCRPQEPHSLRQTAVTGDVPSLSELGLRLYLKQGAMSSFVSYLATIKPGD